MKQFLVIYYAPAEAVGNMESMTQEEKMASLKPWMDWKAAHDENILNFGAPLMPGQDRNGTQEWKGSTKQVSGFSIVQSENIEGAKAMCTNHPHLSWNDACSLGVYEFIPM